MVRAPVPAAPHPDEIGSGEPANVLLVEDDDRLRARLQKYLTDQGFLVVTAGDAAAARQRLAALDFDLIIMDLMMPGEDGLSLTRAIRADRAIPVLILTARDDPSDRIAGLEVGAEDYLAKPFEPRELILRMHNILRRVRAAQPAIETPRGPLRLGTLTYDLDRQELSDGAGPVRLTSAEAKLLHVLASRAGEILSRDRLSDLSRIVGNERTVDVQVTRLRRKIEADPRQPRFLHTVRGEGYVLRPEL